MTVYKVTGPVAYAGHEPGEEFEAELEPDLERRALERGAIEVAGKRSSGKRQAKEDGDA
jgi:hypothetical protein